MDFAKLIVIGLIIIVLFCLFRALYFMVSAKGKEKSKDGVANFLTLRVTFSALLIGFLVLSNYMGWLKFHAPYQDPRMIQKHQMEQQQLEQQKQQKRQAE